jgi:hypothetical protein
MARAARSVGSGRRESTTDRSKEELMSGGIEKLRAFAQRRFGTKQHWRGHVHEKREPAPKRLTSRQYTRLSSAERAAYDERRLAHAGSFTIVTPTMGSIHKGALRTARMNLHRGPGARRNVVVDGLGGLGKSTIVAELGRKWELSLLRGFEIDPEAEPDFIPVAYVTLPSPATIKTLNEALADFYEVVRPSKVTADWLARQVKEAAERCCTSMVIVDDIHYLNLRHESDREVNDHLKYLSNSLAATFVFAGIGLEKTGLLSEGKPGESLSLSQTRRRFVRYPVAPFSLHNDAHRYEWLSLLTAIERHVPLMQSGDGALVALADYLFDRSGGFIGSVVELIRQGAALAIEEGSEKWSEALFDEIDADHASEEEFAKKRRSAKRTKVRRLEDLRAKTNRAKRKPEDGPGERKAA